MEVEQTFVIPNEQGLHARAATRLVQTLSRFRAEVELEKAGQRADGKSIVEVLMLVASKGSTVHVRSRGEEAHAALAALDGLIRARFGEH